MFSVTIHRFPDKWAFATPGEIGPGFFKSIEPVFVFSLSEFEQVMHHIRAFHEKGLPKTAPPEPGYESPLVKALGLKNWRAVDRNSYQWNIDGRENGQFRLTLYDKVQKKPALQKYYNTLDDVAREMESFAYSF